VKRKRGGLFEAWWSDPETGQRGKRATRRELAIAYRLWAIHKDIRMGKP
jgi:hypothetical protein